MGVVLETPVGKIVHTGDFKFDESPARNIAKADIGKIEALGQQNVLALLCESTNSLEPGHTMSEKDVGEALDETVRDAKGRIIIASFSSQIGRVQQIIDAAEKNNRKIFVGGRSMRNNIAISAELGYLKIPKDLVEDMKKYKSKSIPDDQTLIITTGSQGEDVAALARIARNEHPDLKVKKGDTIVFSSSPIPGNEKAINTVINNLCILGAKIIQNKIMDVHTSGHAKQDELARMIKSVNPKYLVPVHGEYYMRQGLGILAQEKCGIREENIIMLQNGDVLVADKSRTVKVEKDAVETKYILIDGRGEGQVGSQVQVDREIMSQNGALIILIKVDKKSKKIKGMPDVITRGFIYMHETEEIAKDVAELARDAYKKIQDKNPGAKSADIKKYIRQTVDKYTHRQLERTPLIVPLMVEI
jgi:ribonuclease J